MDGKGSPKRLYSMMSVIYEGTSKQKIEVFLPILKKIITNILQNPHEPKFRTLNRENKALQERLFVHPNVAELMQGLGFALEGTAYVLHGSDTRALQEFEVIVEAFEVQLEAYKNNLNADPAEVARRQRLVEDEIHQKEAEIAKMNELVHQDRLDKARDLKDRPAVDSKGKDLKFGATVKTTREICPPSSK
jgi:hypothetical protein